MSNYFKIWLIALGITCFSANAQSVVDTICTTAGPSNLAVPYQAGFTYTWGISGGTLISNPDSNDVLIDWGIVPGYYPVWVTASPPTGCGDTTHAVVCLVAPTKAAFKGPAEVCAGTEITLTASMFGNNYTWQGGSKDPEITFIAEKDTTIYLVANNSPCIPDTAYHTVIVVDPPQTALNSIEDTIQVGNDVNAYYTGAPGTQVDWYYDDIWLGSGAYWKYEFEDEGDHQIIQVVSEGTCTDTLVHNVYVRKIFKLWVPSAFTPNGDGINDIFYFDGMGIASYTAIIYNRWGEMVYSWNENEQGWDGITSGVEAPIGVYSYKIVIRDITGLEVVERGTFNLIR